MSTYDEHPCKNIVCPKHEIHVLKRRLKRNLHGKQREARTRTFVSQRPLTIHLFL